MGNPSSVAARRRSPRRRKQFDRRMVKGVFCFVLVVAFAALATALPYRPAPQIDCAAPWTQLSTGCYRFHESPMTQIEAKKFCEEDQEVPAHLVEIDSAEENRAIDAEMQRRNSFSRKINFWLGITDRHSEGDWVLESTGKSVNFTNWNSGEPNNGNGNPGSENCAFINELEKWNDVDCNGKPSNGWTRTALCEKSCEAPWTQLSTGCYRFHESPMTQSEAKKFCEEEQEVPAHLIEIDSVEENNAIIAEMQRQNSYSRKTNFWLGINDRHTEGHWVLESTGESVVFTDWKSGEPNNAGRSGSENCAFINELDKWSDVDCNGKPNNGWTRTAFCEKGEKGASLTRIRATVANEDWAGTDCATKLKTSRRRTSESSFCLANISTPSQESFSSNLL